MTREDILAMFEGVRRAQSPTGFAPHKPLLLLLALARIQHGESALAPLAAYEPKLRQLLTEFGPTSSAQRAHLPFWHLRSDSGGRLWELLAPESLIAKPSGQTPALGALRSPDVRAGFPAEVESALRSQPDLIVEVAQRILDASFPRTLHEDIATEIGLDLHPAEAGASKERRRDPTFRERVLRAYEWRCCVCGFNLQLGGAQAGLEAAHIQWHIAGGPDIEQNGLALCALHHTLFDRGAFTIESENYRIVFSQHAVTGERGLSGVLAQHGQPMLRPQDEDFAPGRPYLAWNQTTVFKAPGRR